MLDFVAELNKLPKEEFQGITREELIKISANMKDGDKILLYSSEKIEFKLFKIKRKVYEVICEFGDRPFTEVFRAMMKAKGL